MRPLPSRVFGALRASPAPLPLPLARFRRGFAASAAQRPMMEGMVVVELANVLAGPTVCQFMAELGATVIKVENSSTVRSPPHPSLYHRRRSPASPALPGHLSLRSPLLQRAQRVRWRGAARRCDPHLEAQIRDGSRLA